MEKYLIVAFLAAGIVFFAAMSYGLLRLNAGRISWYEQLLRNRYLGGVLSAAALAWCVPQVQAVAWTFLANWAWIIAAAALILCVRYLDNMVARGWAGLLIMGAYSYLDMIFDCKLELGLAGAVQAWVWGAVGIVVAAKPCYLRDFLRLAARKTFWKYLTAALSMLTGLWLILTIVIFLKVQG